MNLQKIRFVLEYFENEYGIDGWEANLRTEETAQDWIDRVFFVRMKCGDIWRPDALSTCSHYSDQF
jgi:hypothetical protein